MKSAIKLFFVAASAVALQWPASVRAAAPSPNDVFAVNASGTLQYRDPESGKTLDLGDPDSAFTALKTVAATVSSTKFASIPAWDSTGTGDIFLRSRYAGRFISSDTDPGRLWFVAPGDLRRYFFDATDASLTFFKGYKTDETQKQVVIILSKQVIQEKYGDVVLASYPVSTGTAKRPTPKGQFQIFFKHPRAWSRSSGLWMPWFMQFTKQGVGIHELPEWPGGRKEGAAHLGKPASHGCVRLGTGPAKQMYDWAPLGTTVSVVK